MNNNARTASIILRWGLAFVFFYTAVSSLRHPADWVGFFPHFLRTIFSDHFLLAGFSAVEIILAVWLFMGRKLLWSSGISAILLAGILIFNLDVFDIVFRDVGLLFAALALFELSRSSAHNSNVP